MTTRQPKRSVEEIFVRMYEGLDVTERDLWQLVNFGNFRQQLVLLGYRDLTPDMLDALSGNSNYYVRQSVANHPNVSDDTILSLLDDPDNNVRYAAKRAWCERKGIAYEDFNEQTA